MHAVANKIVNLNDHFPAIVSKAESDYENHIPPRIVLNLLVAIMNHLFMKSKLCREFS